MDLRNVDIVLQHYTALQPEDYDNLIFVGGFHIYIYILIYITIFVTREKKLHCT
jgi:hypothetical protein